MMPICASSQLVITGPCASGLVVYGRRVVRSSDFVAGTKLAVHRRLAAADQRRSYPAPIGNVGFCCPEEHRRPGNVIRCCATKVADKAQKLQDRRESGKIVHVELSIRKASTYTWPPHKVELRLVSSTKLHPVTGNGIVSSEASAFIPPCTDTVKLNVAMVVPDGFGTPGALLLDSQNTEEFFLESMSLRTDDSSTLYDFWCNSWINETKAGAPRILFLNRVYLPNQTPPGLAELRKTELIQLRGNGTGRRVDGERIYDYDVYNDLGNPDQDEASVRPVLGGSEDLPYPRRCRTGRDRTVTDPQAEAPEIGSTPYYVPRDERFTSTKDAAMSQVTTRAITSLPIEDLVAVQNEPFSSLEEIYSLYNDSIPIPAIIKADKDAWWNDEEFARQRLAGLNPLMIERVKVFPLVSTLDPEIYGPPTSAITAQHIEHSLESLTVEQAVSQKRLFVLDYHDALLPALETINSSEFKAYASRTLLFLTNKGVLRPIAIELSLPSEAQGSVNRVFTPPRPEPRDGDHDMLLWFWRLAKAQVAINDTGYHQLISHWLRSHACVEPFVIATHRQLSALHPINRLLFPHFKDTMSINANARKSLINSGGIIESSFFPRDFCMQLSSIVYRSWRFDEQALPQDLIKRGMAERDPQGRLTLTINDYPYAVDGLEVWATIQTWVRDYLAIYYQNDRAVRDDSELQNWWKEIKERGHADHSHAEWWGTMETKKELEETLVTLIWIAAGHHAGVNFGQYAYAGFMPNSPTTGRRSIPEHTNSEELANLREDPEKFFLSSLSTHLEAISVMVTLLLLSQHIEEAFLGQRTDLNWTADPTVLASFQKFVQNLKQVEANIQARNADETKYKNRYGPARIPYMLLFPSSDQGLTSQGVPNSISI